MDIAFKYSLIEESSKFIFRITYWVVVKTCQCFKISRIRKFVIGSFYFMRRGFF